MKIIIPDYYKDFKCIADKCKHSCCKGWEIEIDENSCARFSRHEDIWKYVETGDSPHFRLSDDEVCPFLLENGLCNMILKYGEDFLCQTCTDHPRFRNYWSDRIEMGLGLVCEEAARIILTRTSPMRLVSFPDNNEVPSDLTPEDNTCVANITSTDTPTADSLPTDTPAADTVSTDTPAADTVPTDTPAVDSLPTDSSAADTSSTPTNTSQDLTEEELWLLNLRDAMISQITDNGPIARLKEYLIYRHIPDALYDDRLEERIAFINYFLEQSEKARARSDQSIEALIEIVRQLSYDLEYDEEEKERILSSFQQKPV